MYEVLDTALPLVKKYRREFKRIFKYKTLRTLPNVVTYGPQEESDYIESIIDKSIAERKDYLAEYLGYDIEYMKNPGPDILVD